MTQPRTLLHVFHSFEAGGAQVRATRLWPALGDGVRHAVCALDGKWEAAELLPDDFPLQRVDPPPKRGTLQTARFGLRLLRDLRPAVLCTYNWGSMDVVLAARGQGLRAHVHHEDGFGPEEAVRQKRRRVWTRRRLLRGAHGVVVPSKRLHDLAVHTWKLPEERVHLVPNGLDGEHFSPGGRDGLRAELGVPDDAPLVGCVGRLRREKNVPRLLRAAALVERPDLHVLVVGDGDQRPEVERFAAEGPLAGRVHFAGHQSDLPRWYRAMDVFALVSDTEQMPVALLEAMATELPVVATDVGDVRSILPPSQVEHVHALGEDVDEGLAASLAYLCGEAAMRGRLGADNLTRVVEDYSFDGMVATYRELYAAAAAR